MALKLACGRVTGNKESTIGGLILWEEAENRWVNRLSIEPQTFCGLKEIELKTMNILRKYQQCVTIMQSRLANKKRLLATPTRKTTWSNALTITVQME